ncbi:hypothetical protein E2P81_ATG08564 [Venturia nashicola]|nr:hypothetical protein E2P81_ATG08564 [Venturia nashicola]
MKDGPNWVTTDKERLRCQEQEDRQLFSLGALVSSLGALVSSLASGGQFTPAAPPRSSSDLITLTAPSSPDEEARDRSLEMVGIVVRIVEEGEGGDEEMEEEENEEEDEDEEMGEEDDDDDDDDEMEREMDLPRHYGAFYGD